jgi:hypothetical protein
MTQSLTEFFQAKKQKSDAETAAIDWNRRRNDWIAAINMLYADISNWLAAPIRLGSVHLDYAPARSITEEHLGTYEVQDLVLTSGDERVVFSPKARNVAGVEGRVDVIGESGHAMLVVGPGQQWSIVTTRSPRLVFEPLDEDSFAEMIEAVMRQC